MIGYHASHEQYSPRDLLRHLQSAEKAGFQAFMCSDHFAPWSLRQGQSGQAWVWLGAALQATRIPGGFVCAPGQRYHPAIVAQALATMSDLFPGRIWVALGSGQYLNEHITGDVWPEKEERNERLRECVEAIRRLHDGEMINHEGRVRIRNAKLYSKPATRVPLLIPALSAKTARWAGAWADGLITVGTDDPKGMKEVLQAFREGGGRNKAAYLQDQISYARSEEEALAQAFDQWRPNGYASHVLGDLELPESFDEVARFLRPEDVKAFIRVSSDPAKHRDWILRSLELGFDRVYLHNVGRNQDEFLEDFGDKVLPQIGIQ